MTTRFKTLTAVLLACAVAAPALALAQGPDDHHDDHPPMQGPHGGPPHPPMQHPEPPHPGPGPQAWHKGDRMPAQYRGSRYVVNDWRGHHLRQPPRGYHWVQANGNFVLAAIATGVIADVILSQ